MVQLADHGKLRPASGAAPVKLEAEDFLEEEHGPLDKRSKFSAPFQRQWNQDASTVSSQPAHYNPLDEPSPLGLRLRKSPSLLDLIQMKLSQGSAAKSCLGSTDGLESGEKKDIKCTVLSATTDKLKASNFPASLLRIGTWECVSRYEGDLVAKCYYAKHKLVWEVLEGGLKSKIEIQWSDITALKSTCPENGPGTMDLLLARQPLFFRETNPQPRKHTLWQATSDFTGGQASMHRRHFLQCPQGLLSKHFEKLIQCDPRLNSLSRKPDIILESPYFEARCSVFEDQDETKCHGFDNMEGEYGSPFSGFHDAASLSAGLSSSSKSELRDPVRTPDRVSRETASPSSVMDSQAIEENASSEAEWPKDLKNWDQFKVPGLHASMSMSDLVNHIGNCISEQITSGNPLFASDAMTNKAVLEEIAQYLLSDSQQSAASAASDEYSLMSRVNSLCCLLQKDPATSQNLPMNKNVPEDDDEPGPGRQSIFERKPVMEFPTMDGGCDHASASKQPPPLPGMSRKESFGDLLLHHLPRISSLPQFLFNISEDCENHAR